MSAPEGWDPTPEERAELMAMHMRRLRDAYDVAVGAMAHGEVGVGMTALSALETMARKGQELACGLFPGEALRACLEVDRNTLAVKKRLEDDSATHWDDMQRTAEIMGYDCIDDLVAEAKGEAG